MTSVPSEAFCTKALDLCTSFTDINVAAISAIAAVISSLAAGAGLFYSHQSKNQASRQSSRDTFDRMHGDEFESIFKNVTQKIRELSGLLLSPHISPSQITNFLELAQQVPTADLRRVCGEICTTQDNNPLLAHADQVEAAVSTLYGIVARGTSSLNWFTQANEIVETIQKSLSALRNDVYKIRDKFRPC